MTATTEADPKPGYAAMRGRQQALRGHAAMLGFSAAVSGSFSLGALVANDIAPVALTSVRFLLASMVLAVMVVLLPAAGRNGARGFTREDLRAPWRYAVLAMFYGGYFVLMFEALKTADPVQAGAIFTLTPLMTALIAVPLLGQRLLPRVAGALAIGAAGAAWVIFRGDWTAMARFEVGPGEQLYFLGCVLHAFYAPALKRLNRGESAFVTASLMTLAGFILFAAYGWREIAATDWLALPGRVWLVLAYLVVFATALAGSAMQFAAQRLPASRVMAYTYGTPVWVILWELGLGHRIPGAIVLPGIGLIAVALLVLLRAD
ncbi:DMT family transporter [Rhodobacter sp. NTK016B]|uniref:DMT family transporter n=1 Tax=Rhodobacter sp. NTK016B TaxID=2759676 RepID=UPI00256FF2DF|nr:DMT family transporter [Rhodobacter sp. NTK016B]